MTPGPERRAGSHPAHPYRQPTPQPDKPARGLADQFLFEWWIAGWVLAGALIGLFGGSAAFAIGWIAGGLLAPPLHGHWRKR